MKIAKKLLLTIDKSVSVCYNNLRRLCETFGFLRLFPPNSRVERSWPQRSLLLFQHKNRGVAQMVARLVRDQEAAGSNPVTSTKKRTTALTVVVCFFIRVMCKFEAVAKRRRFTFAARRSESSLSRRRASASSFKNTLSLRPKDRQMTVFFRSFQDLTYALHTKSCLLFVGRTRQITQCYRFSLVPLRAGHRRVSYDFVSINLTRYTRALGDTV